MESPPGSPPRSSSNRNEPPPPPKKTKKSKKIDRMEISDDDENFQQEPKFKKRRVNRRILVPSVEEQKYIDRDKLPPQQRTLKSHMIKEYLKKLPSDLISELSFNAIDKVSRFLYSYVLDVLNPYLYRQFLFEEVGYIEDLNDKEIDEMVEKLEEYYKFLEKLSEKFPLLTVNKNVYKFLEEHRTSKKDLPNIEKMFYLNNEEASEIVVNFDGSIESSEKFLHWIQKNKYMDYILLMNVKKGSYIVYTYEIETMTEMYEKVYSLFEHLSDIYLESIGAYVSIIKIVKIY